MILYHHTARQYLPMIANLGLCRGEVPITRHEEDCLNAVWFTSDGNAEGHGLSGSLWNKRAIRMTVHIPRGDRNLVSWCSWGRKRLTPSWFDTLNRTGGGKARTWFLYWDTVPVDWIREVRDLENGVPLTDWASNKMMPLSDMLTFANAA